MRLSVQIALLGATAALVAAQVPSRAFRFRPNVEPALVPGASLVALDDEAFTRLRRQVLASSAHPSRWREGASDREISALALEEALPPPSPLAPDEGFARATLPAAAVTAFSREPLKPASLAAPAALALPPSAAEPSRSSTDLLDLDSYPSLSP